LEYGVQVGIDASIARIVEDKDTNGMDQARVENTHQQHSTGLDAKDAVDKQRLLAVVRETVTESTLKRIFDTECCERSVHSIEHSPLLGGSLHSIHEGGFEFQALHTRFPLGRRGRQSSRNRMAFDIRHYSSTARTS